jgi:magnesium transporter
MFTGISAISYNRNVARYQRDVTLKELKKPQSGVLWINVDGLKDPEIINGICKKFSIHELTREDILNPNSRPKSEQFADYLFVSLKSLSFSTLNQAHKLLGELIVDHVSILIAKHLVITIQEIPGDPFDAIRKRIMDDNSRFRTSGEDYLAYSLIDAVVDEYVQSLETLEDASDELEERVDEQDKNFSTAIQELKSTLQRMRRAIAPLRDSVATLHREGQLFAQSELRPYLQDLREHISECLETIDNTRELLTGLAEANLARVSNELNQIMKYLTILSAIFIPLTFIAGVYGMNFKHMPELDWLWSYPMVWIIMIAVAVLMLVIFKRMKWI